MSYERLAAVPAPTPPATTPVAQPARVSFYYAVDDVFDDASLRSMYQAKAIKSDAGNSMVDDYAITEDERAIHLGLMEDAVFDIFTNFLKYTKSLATPIEHNASYTDTQSVPVTAVCSWVQMVDHAAFNVNYLKALDKNFIKAIRFYVLRDWFALCKRNDEAVQFNALYLMAVRNIEKFAFELKKVSLS